MITKEAILHIPKSSFSYAYDAKTLHLRVRTKKGEVQKVVLRIGDPYIWEQGGGDGNLNAADASGWISSSNLVMKKEAETEMFDYWFTSYQPPKKRSRYAFVLETEEEKLLYGEKRIEVLTGESDHRVLNDMANFFSFPYLNTCDVAQMPDWVKDTVWYQIFPDRFNKGDKSLDPVDVQAWGSKPTYYNFTGGDLQGIVDKLDYLYELGISGIYFCPIFEAKSNHRYDTVDYMKIDRHLGDEKILKKLVDEAHKRGIKIMLDAVFNHMGFFSKEWQDVVKNNEKSKYRDWFLIHRFPVVDGPIEKLDGNKLNYETFGKSVKMPKVNTENPEVIHHFMAISKYWIETFNIDAWRIDVANEVDHKFWRLFRETVKSINKDIYILGEIWHDASPWLGGDQFDAAMNYPLTDVMIKYFCTNELEKDAFIFAVNKIKVSSYLQVTETTFNLLDSHDTSRIITIAGGNKKKAKLAFLFMFTQMGSPCIYYGSEVGMAGEKAYQKEDHRACMVWETPNIDQDFYDFMKKMIHLRNTYAAFKNCDNKWVSLLEDILYYKKGSIHILINNTKKAITLNLPEELAKKKGVNLFTGEQIYMANKIKINGYAFKILKVKSNAL